MNLPLSYALTDVMALAVDTGLFSSLCTIQRPDGLSIEAGSPSGLYVPVLTDIPCTAPPMSSSNIKASSMKTLQTVEGADYLHVLLSGYYPQIPPAVSLWQAVIDGTAYDLLGAESDSQKQMTRLNVRFTAE